MTTLKVSIWFNEEMPLDKDFAEGFSADLNKCLHRYLPEHSIEVVFNKEGGAYCFLVVSVEGANATPLCLNKKKNIQPLHIKPLKQPDQALGQPILFWDKQFETGEVRLYRRDIDSTKLNYWEKITDIAIDIHSEINMSSEKASKPRVYLSQEESSLNQDRENLRRDLTDLGFEVLPNKPFSLDFNTCTREVEGALRETIMVIHVVPPVYNVQFAESHLSVTEHQCNLSAKFIAEGNMDVIRIIWIPSAYEITDEDNQIFIEKIQRDQTQTRNTFVLKSSIEDLKKYYRQRIEKINPDDEHAPTADVYLVVDNVVFEANIRQQLNGLKVSSPSDFNGITFGQHLKELALAKSVVVCYSSPNKQWLAVKANDILKSKGIDSAKQFESIVLYKTSGELETKESEGVFTHIVNDSEQLAKIVKQSVINKNS